MPDVACVTVLVDLDALPAIAADSPGNAPVVACDLNRFEEPEIDDP